MKRGLFFDLDGTLADTLPLLRKTCRHFLTEQGRSYRDEEFDAINGPPLERAVSILKRRHQLAAPETELVVRYMKLLEKVYIEAKPNSGAGDILAHAIDRGWVCAVVTSNSEALTREWLARNNLLGAISDIVGKESIRVGKPDPEPYLVALRRLGCEADKSIAVEDSVAGIISASKARMRTFAYIPNQNTAFGVLPIESSIIRNLLDLKSWLTYA